MSNPCEDREEDGYNEVEAFYKNLTAWFQRYKIILLFTLAAVVSIAGVTSLVYTVEPSEEAVVLRFGSYVSTQPPGIHFKLPFGVDKAIKVKTKIILQEEFGSLPQSTVDKRNGRGQSNPYLRRSHERRPRFLQFCAHPGSLQKSHPRRNYPYIINR